MHIAKYWHIDISGIYCRTSTPFSKDISWLSGEVELLKIKEICKVAILGSSELCWILDVNRGCLSFASICWDLNFSSIVLKSCFLELQSVKSDPSVYHVNDPVPFYARDIVCNATHIVLFRLHELCSPLSGYCCFCKPFLSAIWSCFVIL